MGKGNGSSPPGFPDKHPGGIPNNFLITQNSLDLTAYRELRNFEEPVRGAEIMTKDQLVPNIGTNPVYYILRQIKLVVLVGTINPNFNHLSSPELVPVSETNLRDVGSILASDGLRRVAWYFLDYMAASSLILQFRANIPKTTSFRHIETLQKMGVIMPAIKSRHPVDTKGGPRPTIWMLPDAKLDQIKDAQKLHHKLQSPKYVAGDRLGQLILEEYLEPRSVNVITGKEVWIEARKHKVTGDLSDIVDFAMQYLKEQGIKVWK